MGSILVHPLDVIILTVVLVILALVIAKCLWTFWFTKKIQELEFVSEITGSQVDLEELEKDAEIIFKKSEAVRRQASKLRFQQLQSARKHELKDKVNEEIQKSKGEDN